jgi:predicted metal-dependent hydrolase
MPAGGGDLERALGAFLALDVGKVERHAVDLAHLRLRAREHLRALEVIGELDERLRRHDLDLGRGPGRFRSA